MFGMLQKIKINSHLANKSLSTLLLTERWSCEVGEILTTAVVLWVETSYDFFFSLCNALLWSVKCAGLSLITVLEAATTEQDLVKLYAQRFRVNSVMQTNKTTKALQSRPRKTICQWLHFIEVSCSCGVWRLCAAANSLWSYWLTLWVCSRGACFYVFGFSLCCALAQQLYLAAEIPQLGRKAGGCGTSGWVEGRKVDQWHHTVSLSCQHQIQGPRG